VKSSSIPILVQRSVLLLIYIVLLSPYRSLGQMGLVLARRYRVQRIEHFAGGGSLFAVGGGGLVIGSAGMRLMRFGYFYILSAH